MLALTMLYVDENHTSIDENHTSMFGQLSDSEVGLAGKPV